ncbi:hypothetical protein N9X12_03965 [Alphaproteobacteria bacterium]|nr:hypothetical protein [Alphaproteobacteria bacterium]
MDQIDLFNIEHNPSTEVVISETKPSLTPKPVKSQKLPTDSSDINILAFASKHQRDMWRAFKHRRADVGADVYKGLVDRYISSNNSNINNMMNANAGLKNTYGIGFGMGGQIGDMMTKSGTALQNNQQGFLDAERDAFVRDRDFAMNRYGDYNSKILGRAPQSSNQTPNMSNPYTATLGGAMAGFGLGQGFANMFTPPPQVNNSQFGYNTGVQRPYIPYGL